MLPLLPVGAYNYVAHGFFGTEKITGTVLFNTAAQFVDLSRIGDENVKKLLAPFYRTLEDRARLADIGWVYSDPNGPRHTLQLNLPKTVDANAIMLNLSLRAFVRSPWQQSPN